MPTYDYKCLNCDHVFEMNKKISERDVNKDDVCPSCSKTGVERMLSAPLVGYSITVNGGYGSKIPAGFKEVLQKIDRRSPGSRMKETSSFL